MGAANYTPAPEGAQGAGGVQPESQPQSGAPPAPDAQPAQQPSGGGDLRSRFSDPDFAWNQYTELQSKATKDQQRLKAVSRLIPVAEALGNQVDGPGSALERGFRALETELEKWGRINSNPQMLDMATQFLESNVVPTLSSASPPGEEDDLGGELMDGTRIEQHPLVKQLTQNHTVMSTRLNQLESQSARREVNANMDDFFASHELGKRFTPDERGEFVAELLQTVQQASQNPNLRDQLRASLGPEYIANAAFAWANKGGRLSEMMMRGAQDLLDRKTELGTESPNPGMSTSGGDVGQADLGAVDALKEWARKEGIDLHNLPA